MAELLIKTGDNGSWEDGDCLNCYRDIDIQCEHAHQICHPWKCELTNQGLIPVTDLAFTLMTLNSKHMFERISRDWVRKTNLVTLETEVIGKTPNAKGIAMDVSLYIAGRKKNRRKSGHVKKPMFGAEGAEIWFGGNNRSDAATTAIWDEIEVKTSKRRTDRAYQRAPGGFEQNKYHLAIHVQDFTVEDKINMLYPHTELDGNGEPVWVRRGSTHEIEHRGGIDPPDDGNSWDQKVIGRRVVATEWREALPDLGITEAQALDKNFFVGELVDLGDGKFRPESKDQTKQTNRDSVKSKRVK